MSRTMLLQAVGIAALLALLAGCQATLPPQVAAPVSLPEAWTSPAEEAANIDSVAVWHGPAGERWLVATAKSTHVLRVYDADSGAVLRDVGERGSAAGQFQRPNGIWIEGNLLFVVERDNQRVQVLGLPGFEPLTSFGADRLQKPYGIYVQALEDGWSVYVTDAYELAGGRIPPAVMLDRRIQQWTLRETSTGLVATPLRAFGETSGPGVLRVVESLYGDPAQDRLLIAEEDESRHPDSRTVKIYDLAGRYTGPLLGQGLFQGQVEGVALRACRDGSGQWLVADQSQRSNRFHLFDRVSLAHIGSFEGPATRNTDGIWYSNHASARFSGGAFYAVHDDQAVSAFDWNTIAAAFRLAPGTC